jgi:hypothetical protein
MTGATRGLTPISKKLFAVCMTWAARTALNAGWAIGSSVGYMA